MMGVKMINKTKLPLNIVIGLTKGRKPINNFVANKLCSESASPTIALPVSDPYLSANREIIKKFRTYGEFM